MILPYNGNRQVQPYRPVYYGAGWAPVGAMAYEGAKYAYNAYKNYKNKPRVPMVQAPVQKVEVVSHKQAKKPKKVRKPKTLKKQVKSIQRQLNNLNSTCVYRGVDVQAIKALQNATAYGEFNHSDITFIELALANLRFFDPATPGTLITGSGASGTYQRQYRCQTTSNFVIRNNYQVPVEVRVYKYKSKYDTSISVSTAFTNGLTDVGNPSSSSLVVYPSDSKQINDVWTPKGCSIWVLKPGEQKTYKIYTPEFLYDPADTDSHNLTYQKQYQAHSLLIRVAGVAAHDKTTPTQLGTIACGVDVFWKRVVKIKYNSGGPELETIVVSDNTDSMTAGPVVSEFVADNLEYSVN